MRVEIRGVEKLSFRERQVVALKEMGASNEQIARRLGISESTIGTLLNRARKKGYEVVIVLEGDPLALFTEENPDPDTDMEADDVGEGEEKR